MDHHIDDWFMAQLLSPIDAMFEFLNILALLALWAGIHPVISGANIFPMFLSSSRLRPSSTSPIYCCIYMVVEALLHAGSLVCFHHHRHPGHLMSRCPEYLSGGGSATLWLSSVADSQLLHLLPSPIISSTFLAREPCFATGAFGYHDEPWCIPPRALIPSLIQIWSAVELA